MSEYDVSAFFSVTSLTRSSNREANVAGNAPQAFGDQVNLGVTVESQPEETQGSGQSGQKAATGGQKFRFELA